MFTLNVKEEKARLAILSDCERMLEHQGKQKYQPTYYIEVWPGAIGPSFFMCVPDFNIRKDITDTSSW